MALDDAVGTPDPTGVVESILRGYQPDLGSGPVNPMDVAARTLRKVTPDAQRAIQNMRVPGSAPQDEPQPTTSPPPDLSGYGTPASFKPVDLSGYGKPVGPTKTPPSTEQPTGEQPASGTAPPATGTSALSSAADFVGGAVETAGQKFGQESIGTVGQEVKEVGVEADRRRGHLAPYYDSYATWPTLSPGEQDHVRQQVQKDPKLLYGEKVDLLTGFAQRESGQPAKSVDEFAGPQPGQGPLEKAGEAIIQKGKKAFPLDEKTEAEHPWAAFGGGMAGGIAGMTVTGAIGSAVGLPPVINTLVAAGQMGLAGGAQTFDEAIKKGATPERAAEAAHLSTQVNTLLGAIPLHTILAPIERTSPGWMGLASALLDRAVKSGVQFATIGEAQQYLATEIAKRFYDPNSEYSVDTKRVVGNFLGGAIMGAAHGAGGVALSDRDVDAFLARAGASGQGGPTQRGAAWRQQIDDFLAARAAGQPPPNPLGGAPGTPPPGPQPQPGGPPPSGAPPPAVIPPAAAGGAAPPSQTPPGPQPTPTAATPTPPPEAPRETSSTAAEMGLTRRQVDDILGAYGLSPDDIQKLREQNPSNLADWLRQAKDDGLVGAHRPGSAANPAEDAATAAAHADADHTGPQQEAGNARLGHQVWNGLAIKYETAKGGARRGVTPEGTPFETTMGAHAGYISGVPLAADGQEPDVYSGDHTGAKEAYVIDEVDPKTGDYRQSKSFIDFPNQQAAVDAYLGTSTKTRDMIGGVKAMPISDFVQLAKGGGLSQPVAGTGLGELTNDSTGLASMGGKMGAGIVDSLYDHLWKRVLGGHLNETSNSPNSALLQAAKMVRQQGGLPDIDTFRAMAQEYANIQSGPNFQRDMRALVAKYATRETRETSGPNGAGAGQQAGVPPVPTQPGGGAEAGGGAGEGGANGQTAQGGTGAQPRQMNIDLSGRPDWVREQLERSWAMGNQLGVIDDIERMAADEKTAGAIEKELGPRLDRVREIAKLNGEPEGNASREFVRQIRVGLQIPSQEDHKEFQAWQHEYFTRNRPAWSDEDITAALTSAADEAFGESDNTHVEQAEKAMEQAGVDPAGERHADIAEAAHILAEHFGVPADMAFPLAVLRNLVRDGLMPEAALREVFGDRQDQAQVVLGPGVGTPRGVSAEAPSAGAGGAHPEDQTERGQVGAENGPQGGREGQAPTDREGAERPPGTEESRGGTPTEDGLREHAPATGGRVSEGGKPADELGPTANGERNAEHDAGGSTEPAGGANRPSEESAERKPSRPTRASPTVEHDSLLGFIASKGGIRPDGDLKALGLPESVRIPGKGYRMLRRGGGMTMDQLVEQMQGAGYLPAPAKDQPPDAGLHNKIRAMIDEELRGEHVHRPQGKELQKSKHEVQRAEDEAHAKAHEDLAHALHEASIDPANVPEVDLNHAAELILKGVDPLDAVDQAIMKGAEDDGDLPADYTNPEAGAGEAFPPEGPGGEWGRPPEAAAPEGAGDEAAGQAPVTEHTEAGEQGVIPGAEKEGEGKQAQRKADQPLKPKVAQKPMDIGLFGDEQNQTDLVDLLKQPTKNEALEKLKKQIVLISSGMSRARDLAAGSSVYGDVKNRGIGVDAGELSNQAIDQLARAVIDHRAQLFVDSGAFGVFRRNMRNKAKADADAASLFGENKPAQFETMDFDKLFERYDTLLDRIEKHNEAEENQYPRPLMVMPDIVGDQAGSLELVGNYAPQIATETKFNISQPIVPIQRGPLSLADAYKQIVDTLGTDNFIVGIPSNEKAVPLEELRKFLAEAKPKKIHFLGSASEKNLEPKLQAIADAGIEPEHLSADANLLRAQLYGKPIETTRADAIKDTLTKNLPKEPDGPTINQVSHRRTQGIEVGFGSYTGYASTEDGGWLSVQSYGKDPADAQKNAVDRLKTEWLARRERTRATETIHGDEMDAKIVPNEDGKRFNVSLIDRDSGEVVTTRIVGTKADARETAKDMLFGPERGKEKPEGNWSDQDILDALTEAADKEVGKSEAEQGPPKDRYEATWRTLSHDDRENLLRGIGELQAEKFREIAWPDLSDRDRQALTDLIDQLREPEAAPAPTPAAEGMAEADARRIAKAQGMEIKKAKKGSGYTVVIRGKGREIHAASWTSALENLEAIFGAATGKQGVESPAATKPVDERPTSEVAKSAAGHFSKATQEAGEALVKLFGAEPGGNTLGAGPHFTEETYAKAKPHFEQFAREFREVLRDLKEFARRLIAAVRDAFKMAREGIDRMMPYLVRFIKDVDSGKIVIPEGEKLSEKAPSAPPEKGPVETPAPRPKAPAKSLVTLADHFEDHFRSGNGFGTIVEARKFAKDKGFGEDPKGIEEAIELGVVRVARDLAIAPNADNHQRFQALVDLYHRQPNLGTRTSTSIREQAYSTPVPLAYVVDHLADVHYDTRVYEPTAGNGALLLTARPDNTITNEINPDRRKNLESQGFKPAAWDASDPNLETAIKNVFGGADRVVANPPFGTVKEKGVSKVFDLSSIQQGYRTHEIDHAIALRALTAMHPDGKAALILGGINKLNATPEARSDAYNAKAKREFFYTLYNHYNVVDHFTVNGDLYSKQGAAWPVDVVIINGRGKSSLKLPAVEVPRQYDSWDQLGELLHAQPSANRPDAPPAQPPNATAPQGAGPRGASSGAAGSGGAATTGGRRPSGAGSGEPAPVEHGPSGGQSEPGVPSDTGAGPEAEPPGIRESIGPGDKPVAERRAPELSPEAAQVPYTPRSAQGPLNTLVPVNLDTAIHDALDAVQSRHGDLDEFVARELGYDPKELGKYFGAEQVDALALAIDNLRRGAGFIIGDQTGIGKGRVNAAIIRWAHVNDRIPIFVTEKPNLYGDMHRDLVDIGFPDYLKDITPGGFKGPRYLMTNAAQDVPLTDDGSLRLQTENTTSHNALLRDLPTDPKEFLKQYDAVFTNYSQMQTLNRNETPRRDFLRRIAPGGVLILDESHNAGGQALDRPKPGPADRAQFVRGLVRGANGVFYSSATYAKRPDVMDLYSATDMPRAVRTPKDLGPMIARGGVPMQQVVAAMLAKGGQYMRRERSFDGIRYDTPTIPVDREAYDQFSHAMAAINDLSIMVEAATELIDQQLKNDAAKVSPDGATGGAGADSTNFTSIMHNIVNQMLLAMKAKPAAAKAIEALKNGEKPVLTVSATMEAFLKDAADTLGINHGDPVSINFNDVLHRYLERTRAITIKRPFSAEPGRRHYLTDEQLGDRGTAIYENAKNLINMINLGDLPVSPIDMIKHEIRKAGFTVGEITGRGNIIDYSGQYPLYKPRPAGEVSIKGRKATIAKFNGEHPTEGLDALVINQAGSTGLSIHASEKFKDQRPRAMFVVQPEANIDTHMQLLGRINRTGQVALPRYEQLVADIPAEKRPAAVLAKKMASLNANTTGARGSAVTSKEVPDFMNIYGDRVAHALMRGDDDQMRDFHRYLGYPVDSSDPNGDEWMRRVTGRIPLLPLKDQEILYDRLEAEYVDYLRQMEASGENALEAKTLPLEAKTLETREAVPMRGAGHSPFEAPVQMVRAKVKRLGKPFPSDELVNRVAEAHGITDIQGVTRQNSHEKLAQIQSRFPVRNDTYPNWVAPEIDRFSAFKKGVLDRMQAGPDASTTKGQQAIEQARMSMDRQRDDWINLRKVLAPGARVNLTPPGGGNFRGVVLDVVRKGEAKNPLAFSTWRARIALADATRQIDIPLSRLTTSTEAQLFAMRVSPVTDYLEDTRQTLDMFDNQQNSVHEDRWIATGNLLAAFDYLRARGRIINYTDDQGFVRQGILTARDFNMDEHQREQPVPFREAREVAQWLRSQPSLAGLSDQAGVVNLNLRGGRLEIQIAQSRNTGGHYYLDDDLTELTGDFKSRGGTMRADVSMGMAEPVIAQLQNLGAVFNKPGTGGRRPAGRTEITTPPPANPANAEATSNTPVDVKNAVQAEIDRMTGGRVKVNYEDQIPPESIPNMAENLAAHGVESLPEGAYVGGYTQYGRSIGDALVRIAMMAPEEARNPADPLKTGYHEVTHIARNYLWTPHENEIMDREVPRMRQWLADRGVKVDGYDPEEVIANATAEYLKGMNEGEASMRGRGLHIMVRRLFNRIVELLDRVRQAIVGRGYRSWQDVASGLYRGEMADRPGREMADDGPMGATTIRNSLRRARDAAINVSIEPMRRRLADIDAVRTAAEGAMNLADIALKRVLPMAQRDTPDVMRAAFKDFAGLVRKADWETEKVVDQIRRNFSPDEQRHMWEAANEQGEILEAGGTPGPDEGRNTMTPQMQRLVEGQQAVGTAVAQALIDIGRMAGPLKPYYVPRMMVGMSSTGHYEPAGRQPGIPGTSEYGRQYRTKTGQMMRRKYLLAEQTEAAMRAKFGPDVQIARNIMALPLAINKMRKALYLSTLIEQIKAQGNALGVPTVAYAPHRDYFTLDHPSFYEWRPQMNRSPLTGRNRPRLDQAGEIVWERKPIYVHRSFEGPLKAVLGRDTNKVYQALMTLKGKSMGVIMYSPVIHNMVEFSRSIPAAPVALGLHPLRFYLAGNALKNDRAAMGEAIRVGGMVPIGRRFAMQQEISDLMEEAEAGPGRSLTAKSFGLIGDALGVNGDRARVAIDKAGDVWHNTLLWDRVADLQAGLYAHTRDQLLAKGFDRQTAVRIAGHIANRYAGALPLESMSTGARMAANLIYFSRSYTFGNLGVVKDAIKGLPRDVQAQILRDAGAETLRKANDYVMNKSTAAIAIDYAIKVIAGAVFASALATLVKGLGQNDKIAGLKQAAWDEAMGYVRRVKNEMHHLGKHPLDAIQHPFKTMEGWTPQAEYEPSKAYRPYVKMGKDSHGSSIYWKNPYGRMGEEFEDWGSEPFEMQKRKFGPYAKAGYGILFNDQMYPNEMGDKSPVFDPRAGASNLKRAWDISKYAVEQFLPTEALTSIAGMAGVGPYAKNDEKVNAAKIVMPLVPLFGGTVSKGFPGGKAAAEEFEAKKEHELDRKFGKLPHGAY